MIYQLLCEETDRCWAGLSDSTMSAKESLTRNLLRQNHGPPIRIDISCSKQADEVSFLLPRQPMVWKVAVILASLKLERFKDIWFRNARGTRRFRRAHITNSPYVDTLKWKSRPWSVGIHRGVREIRERWTKVFLRGGIFSAGRDFPTTTCTDVYIAHWLSTTRQANDSQVYFVSPTGASMGS